MAPAPPPPSCCWMATASSATIILALSPRRNWPGGLRLCRNGRGLFRRSSGARHLVVLRAAADSLPGGVSPTPVLPGGHRERPIAFPRPCEGRSEERRVGKEG